MKSWVSHPAVWVVSQHLCGSAPLLFLSHLCSRMKLLLLLLLDRTPRCLPAVPLQHFIQKLSVVRPQRLSTGLLQPAPVLPHLLSHVFSVGGCEFSGQVGARRQLPLTLCGPVWFCWALMIEIRLWLRRLGLRRTQLWLGHRSSAAVEPRHWDG